MREIARRRDIAGMIAKHIPDPRNPLLITHTYADMIRTRMMMIAAGYEDCDDVDALKTDPPFKIACDRAPETGVDLMSPADTLAAGEYAGRDGAVQDRPWFHR